MHSLKVTNWECRPFDRLETFRFEYEYKFSSVRALVERTRFQAIVVLSTKCLLKIARASWNFVYSYWDLKISIKNNQQRALHSAWGYDKFISSVLYGNWDIVQEVHVTFDFAETIVDDFRQIKPTQRRSIYNHFKRFVGFDWPDKRLMLTHYFLELVSWVHNTILIESARSKFAQLDDLSSIKFKQAGVPFHLRTLAISNCFFDHSLSIGWNFTWCMSFWISHTVQHRK